MLALLRVLDPPAAEALRRRIKAKIRRRLRVIKKHSSNG
jgi:hypothetical protein